MIQRLVRNGLPPSGSIANLTVGDLAVSGAATIGTTLGVAGTTTLAAVNASGTIAAAGAVTVGTTLGVTGTSNLAAVNASGLVAAAAAVTVGTTLAVTGASTLTGDIAAGNINMASGKIVTLAAGSLAAPSLRFAGSNVGTGFSAASADNIQLGRTGASQIRFGAGGPAPLIDENLTCGGAVTVNTGPCNFQGRLGIGSETVKTANYQVTNSDAIIKMNGTTLTMTSPATPGTDQVLFIINYNASPGTFGRNGLNINGAAADLVLAQGIHILSWDGTGWYGM